MLWPQSLSFGPDSYRSFDLAELGRIVKHNVIPLCIFEANVDVADAQQNQRSFQTLHEYLTEHGVV